MGQYYKFVNIDKKQVCEKNRHGWKLMEHSYLGNEYCSDILRLLSDEWKGDRIVHVGDYAQFDDGTSTQNIIKNISDELNIQPDNTLYNYCEAFDNVNPKSKKDIRYVYNIDKKEYVDLFQQPIQSCYCNKDKIGPMKINSFALLIGCGNGQGGGDYWGVNKEYVGHWAGDRFVSSTVPLKEYNNFILRDEIYNETKEYNDLKHYDEESIIDDEINIFNNELELYNKYKYDLSKVNLDSFGLLDNEKKVFESILVINKDHNKEQEEDICL